jgi:hypothetical protein
MVESLLHPLRDLSAAAVARTVRDEKQRILGYPYHWQEPAATERAAYESVSKLHRRRTFTYLAFPWATLIDSLREHSPLAGPLLAALKSVVAENPQGRIVTVAQHIYALQYIELIRSCGVTDLFWSHAQTTTTPPSGVFIHPFPLYPVLGQIDMRSNLDLERPRRYLANFVGAFNATIYISNTRQLIFNDAGKYKDVFIVRRSKWHFDEHTYGRLLHGRAEISNSIIQSNARAAEYADAMQSSWFTLCPTGSGPNSIRIYEALASGSIPIVLTRELCLPGPVALWERAAIIADDNENGYRWALCEARRLSSEERGKMLLAGSELYHLIQPSSYGEYLHHLISQPAACLCI